MVKSLAVFTFGVLLGIALGINRFDRGEYGYDNSFRKSVCETTSEGLHPDMQYCFELEFDAARKAFTGCIRGNPSETSGSITPYFKAACSNRELFYKLDTCLDEAEYKAVLKEEMQVSREASECYMQAARRHGFQDIHFHFD